MQILQGTQIIKQIKSSKVQVFKLTSLLMQEENQIQKLTPLLKIIKRREELYLELLNFISKNIESSSAQHEQLNLFMRFLQQQKLKEKQLNRQEKDLLSIFQRKNWEGQQNQVNIACNITKNNKQILRLCSRLMEILETSVSKIHKSIFNDKNQISLSFIKFKRSLHHIVRGQSIHLEQFTSHLITYVRNKYHQEVIKIQKYIYKLQSGATVALKDLYLNQSDSNDQNEAFVKTYRPKKESVKKFQHNSSTESPTKRNSLKKSSLKSARKVQKLLKSHRKQAKDSSVENNTKQYHANKLLKFYQMLELNKKDFLEDYLFQKNQQQEHQKRLMQSLLEKNKTISVQISTYYKKSISYHDKIKAIQVNNFVYPSSGQQKEPTKDSRYSSSEQPTMPKNPNLRKSFVLRKRKSSLTFDKTSKIITENDESSVNVITNNNRLSKTIRNFNRKSSADDKLKSKNKKLFVVKSPVMFEDDNIPQVPALNGNSGLGGGGWFKGPLTARKTQKKTENLRLKRRNNPLPMEKSFNMNQTFKFNDPNY